VNEIRGGFATRSLIRFHRLHFAWCSRVRDRAGCIRTGRDMQLAWRAKLPCGGGEGAVHSSVVASHGLSFTFSPCLMLQKKLMMKGNLSEPHDPRCPGDRLVPFEAGQSPRRYAHSPGSIPARRPYQRRCIPAMPCKNIGRKIAFMQISVGQKMDFSPELAHLSAGRFREPIVNAGEKSEDCARRNDVMEMRDDVVGVVQIKIG